MKSFKLFLKWLHEISSISKPLFLQQWFYQ